MEIKQESLARQAIVTGTVRANEVLADIEAHYAAEVAPGIEIPGFRKGKVPRQLAEKKLGANEMYRPVLDGYFAKLVSETEGGEVLAHGDFGFAGALNGKEDIVLTCTATFAPRVLSLDIGRALSAVKYNKPSVEETEIDSEVMARCKPHMTEEIEPGGNLAGCETATIDFQGTVDGMPFPGGTATDFVYVAGETDFVSGFEDGLLRMRVGDTGRISVSFPEDYPKDGLAGRPADFTVTVKSAQKLRTTVPTDESARSAGFDSLESLRSRVQEHLLGMRQHEADRAVRQAAANALVDSAVCEMLSNDAIDAMAESAWSQFIDGHGFTEDGYIESRPHLLESAEDAVSARFGIKSEARSGDLFKALCREEAVRAAKAEWKLSRWESLKSDVRTKAVLGHVARENGITATEAEAAARLGEISGDPGVLDRLDADPGFRSRMVRMVAQEKALDWAADRVIEGFQAV